MERLSNTCQASTCPEVQLVRRGFHPSARPRAVAAVTDKQAVWFWPVSVTAGQGRSPGPGLAPAAPESQEPRCYGVLVKASSWKAAFGNGLCPVFLEQGVLTISSRDG